MKKQYIIPIFVAHQGCPHDCVFCNQRKITGTEGLPSQEEIIAKIESHLKTIPSGAKIEVAFYGGTFTALSEEIQRKLLEPVQSFLNKGLVTGVRISTRPDYVNKANLEWLYKWGLRVIELGVQSMDPLVLQQASRGHDSEVVRLSSRLIKEMGFELGIQLMVGLPGDSPERALKTAQEIVDIKPSLVRIYPALVIEGTAMEDLWRSGLYEPWSLEMAVETVTQMVLLFQKENITIIRLGIQATEEISDKGGALLAGPFHSAFAQLVYSKIALWQMQSLLDGVGTKGLKGIREIEFSTNPKNFSNLIGQKRGNLSLLGEKYVGLKIICSSDSELKMGEIKLVRLDGNRVNILSSGGQL